MLSMKQEELIKELDTLNYKELRMAVGVGVPGDAQQFARDKLKVMRERARAATADSTNFAWITTTVKNETPVDEKDSAPKPK